MNSIDIINREVTGCRLCPRLVRWREDCAAAPPRRFAGEAYHARGVPGFGDPEARVLVIGLAPAAHGANRTGRMFTGDRSGEWLYRALHKAGFASRAESVRAGDGLQLSGVYITAAARCAPPDNKPTREEFARCAPFLDREIEALWPRLKVIVVLGALAQKAALAALDRRGVRPAGRAPRFAHGAECELAPSVPALLMSYHPSQQNTFTGLLTESMFDAIWTRARMLAD